MPPSRDPRTFPVLWRLLALGAVVTAALHPLSVPSARAGVSALTVCVADGLGVALSFGRTLVWGKVFENSRDVITTFSKLGSLESARLTFWRARLTDLRARGEPYDVACFREVEGRVAFLEVVSPEYARTLGLEQDFEQIPRGVLNWARELDPLKWVRKNQGTTLGLDPENTVGRATAFTPDLGLSRADIDHTLRMLYTLTNPAWKRMPLWLQGQLPQRMNHQLEMMIRLRLATEDVEGALASLGLLRDSTHLERFRLLRRRNIMVEDGLLAVAVNLAALKLGGWTSLWAPAGNSKLMRTIPPELLALCRTRGVAACMDGMKTAFGGRVMTDRALEVVRVGYSNLVRAYALYLLIRAVPEAWAKAGQFVSTFREPEPSNGPPSPVPAP